MSNSKQTRAFTDIVERLSAPDTLKGLCHQHREGTPLPSGKALAEIVELTRSVLFPGYYGNSTINLETISYHIGVNLERLQHVLAHQILAGLCFAQEAADGGKTDILTHVQRADELAAGLISRLPELRRILATDVSAAYNGDPAAESYGEIISCYPVIKALTNYRLAHELYKMGVPLIPRMITEMAHSETGIDIHPGATIGDHFTIDHGTGVVIGATCIIGSRVKLYQGVTLGAKSFPLDGNGFPVKGIPRHPIIGSDVVIYANATVLGRVNIGDGCVVGANEWVTEDMAPGTVLKASASGTQQENKQDR